MRKSKIVENAKLVIDPTFQLLRIYHAICNTVIVRHHVLSISWKCLSLLEGLRRLLPSFLQLSDAFLAFLITPLDLFYYLFILSSSSGEQYRMMIFDRPAFDNSYISPLPQKNGGWYSEASSTFVVSAPGAYYYICQV